jgi:flagellar motility protein MotE (MotC chaperone)
MMRVLRDLRLLPLAVIASACLLALIAADLLLGRDDPAVSEMPPTEAKVVYANRAGDAAPANQSWAQMMFNFPDAKNPPQERKEFAQLAPLPPMAVDKNNPDITGSVPESGENAPAKDAKDKDAKLPKEPPKVPDGTPVALNGAPGPSPAERAILERLQERRQELDKRARELDIREGLIAEAEKRVETKLNDIKSAQARLETTEQKKDEAEVVRFKSLVTMYETMKPRDAAKIFDRLEVGVLLQVASQINPRNMAEILAQMSPERAERLTVELANRAQAMPKDANAGLPKIEGRPTQ